MHIQVAKIPLQFVPATNSLVLGSIDGLAFLQVRLNIGFLRNDTNVLYVRQVGTSKKFIHTLQ